jgi:hypothetical protein
VTLPIDRNPCIAGASRDPTRTDAKAWRAGVLWLNVSSRRLYQLSRRQNYAVWLDITEGQVISGYLLKVLTSQPVEVLHNIIDTWI